MSKTTGLLDLNFSNYRLDKCHLEKLIKLLKENKVKSLNLSFNGLNDETIKRIIIALVGNKTLENLNLSNNKIGSKGAILLSNILRNSNVIHLNLAFNMIGLSGIKTIGNLLGNKALKELNLDGNKLGLCEANVLSICGQLRESNIERLYLSSNDINSTGAIALVNALKFNTSLLVLGLGSNNIGLSGMKAISDYLYSNKTLRILDLGKNRGLYGNNIVILYKPLTKNNTLRSLNLCGINLGITEAKIIRSIIGENTGLKRLILRENKIGSGIEHIYKGLDENKTLFNLDLAFNNINFNNVKMFTINKSLENLNLSGNEIGPKGANVIKEGLKKNEKLKLKLGLNN